MDVNYHYHYHYKLMDVMFITAGHHRVGGVTSAITHFLEDRIDATGSSHLPHSATIESSRYTHHSCTI